MERLATLLVLLVCVASVQSMYFILGETEKRCFLEELPVDTMLIGKYKVEIYDRTQNKFIPATSGLGMHVEIRDPEDKVILSRTYAMEGRFTFTAHDSGEHQVCIHSNSSAWFGRAELRVHLDLLEGESAVDLVAIQQKEKLTDLQLRIRSLMEHADRIAKEQNYDRVREEHFREVSESTNQRVLWWALAQMAVLLVVGYWQIRHLRSFFEAKKLV